MPVRSAAAPLAALLLLSGCLGGLLGGGKPSQMYRFGAPAASAAAAGPVPAATRSIQLPAVRFADEVATDRLLAVRGAQAMYIKGARWVSPAPELFGAALHDAFRSRAPAVALIDSRDGGAGAAVLQIAVTRFEARYEGSGKDAAPVILIDGQASLIGPGSKGPGTPYHLSASEPAASNRIDDIVAAFDAADARVVAAVADWTAAQP